MTEEIGDKPLVLFDGRCSLCSGTVRFITERDFDYVFEFASLDSEKGRRVLEKFNLPPDKADTIILVEDGGYSVRSEAALRIFKRLGGLWPLLYAFIVIPAPIRDSVYDLISRNRYKWFGRK